MLERALNQGAGTLDAVRIMATVKVWWRYRGLNWRSIRRNVKGKFRQM